LNLLRKILGKAGTLAGIARAYQRGWRSRGPIVVLDSDDWGSIRTASREAYDRLSADGYGMVKSPYSLDALETDEDLQRLYDVLDSVRDARGRPACMTANMIMANPDFERIAQSGFREYFCEPVAATLRREPARAGVAELWNDGLRRKMFVPQLHGREHVRFWEWLDALRAGNSEALATFELRMCGVPFAASKHGASYYCPPYLDDETLQAKGVDLDAMIRQGAEMFREQFGLDSVSTIAPNYCWTDHVEQIWANLGIRYVKSALYQVAGRPDRRLPRHLGQHTSTGGWYLVRNCAFEPTEYGGNQVARCLRDVARAFWFHQPAVIETHRVNYIGSIRLENRQKNLDQLTALLAAIRRRWGDVCFLSSAELGYMIEHDIHDARDLPEKCDVAGGALGSEARLSPAPRNGNEPGLSPGRT